MKRFSRRDFAGGWLLLVGVTMVAPGCASDVSSESVATQDNRQLASLPLLNRYDSALTMDALWRRLQRTYPEEPAFQTARGQKQWLAQTHRFQKAAIGYGIEVETNNLAAIDGYYDPPTIRYDPTTAQNLKVRARKKSAPGQFPAEAQVSSEYVELRIGPFSSLAELYDQEAKVVNAFFDQKCAKTEAQLAADGKAERLKCWPSLQYHVSFLMPPTVPIEVRTRTLDLWASLNEWVNFLSLGEPPPFNSLAKGQRLSVLPDRTSLANQKRWLQDQAQLSDKQLPVGFRTWIYHPIDNDVKILKGLGNYDPENPNAFRYGYEFRKLRFSYALLPYVVAMTTAALERSLQPIRLSPESQEGCTGGEDTYRVQDIAITQRFDKAEVEQQQPCSNELLQFIQECQQQSSPDVGSENHYYFPLFPWENRSTVPEAEHLDFEKARENYVGRVIGALEQRSVNNLGCADVAELLAKALDRWGAETDAAFFW